MSECYENDRDYFDLGWKVLVLCSKALRVRPGPSRPSTYRRAPTFAFTEGIGTADPIWIRPIYGHPSISRIWLPNLSSMDTVYNSDASEISHIEPNVNISITAACVDHFPTAEATNLEPTVCKLSARLSLSLFGDQSRAKRGLAYRGPVSWLLLSSRARYGTIFIRVVEIALREIWTSPLRNVGEILSWGRTKRNV